VLSFVKPFSWGFKRVCYFGEDQKNPKSRWRPNSGPSAWAQPYFKAVCDVKVLVPKGYSYVRECSKYCHIHGNCTFRSTLKESHSLSPDVYVSFLFLLDVRKQSPIIGSHVASESYCCLGYSFNVGCFVIKSYLPFPEISAWGEIPLRNSLYSGCFVAWLLSFLLHWFQQLQSGFCLILENTLFEHKVIITHVSALFMLLLIMNVTAALLEILFVIRVLTLKYYRFFFVTLMISSGLPDPVFKNKKNNTFSFNCSLSQKLHWKYKSHWAIWALTKLLYSDMIRCLMKSK